MNLGNKVAKLLTNKYFLYFVVFLTSVNILGYLVLHNLNALVLFSLIGLISYQFSKNMAVVLLVSLIMTNLFMANKTLKEGLENNSDNNKPSKKEKGSETPQKVDDDAANSSDEAPVPSESQRQGQPAKKGSSTRIDYATTLESAYDNLDKILGSDGIKNLTSDTQTLMKQQQELFQTMQSMTPMLQQAKDMIEGFDMKSLEGLSGLASSFTSSGLAQPK